MKNLYWRLAFQNIFKNKKVYFPYIISITFLVTMTYIIVSLSLNESFLSTLGGQVINNFLILGTFVIAILVFIFLFYSNSFMIKSRRMELGLYNILGLEKRHVMMIMFAEFIYIAIFSIGVGLAFGVLLDKLAFMILLNLSKGSVPIGFSLSIKALIEVSIYYILILFLTFIYNSLQVKHYTAINLLKSDSIGEKEPKAKYLTAILGFAILAYGYYIAISVINPIEAIINFFVAVILVIVGTYMLFIVGVPAILKLLKSKKDYYYRTTHFISVSTLLYRMKKNAVGLANICILSTMVLVMISSTSAIWFSSYSTLHSLYPNDARITINNSLREENTLADSIVEKILNENGFSDDDYVAFNEVYLSGSFENRKIIKSNGENTYILHFVTVDTYNRYTDKNVILADNEIIMLNELSLTFDDKVQIFDKEFDNVLSENKLIKDLPLSPVISDGEIQVVVKDEDVLNSFNATVSRYYGFDLGDRELTDNIVSEIYDSFLEELSETSILSLSNFGELYELMMSVYGGLFFLGIFLSVVFIVAMTLVMYYKQLQESSEDLKRFKIMKKVGLTNKDISRTINSQMWILFFLPLIVAIIHMLFAYNIINKLLVAASMNGSFSYASVFITTIAIFIVIYGIIYKLTSKLYYNIVTV